MNAVSISSLLFSFVSFLALSNFFSVDGLKVDVSSAKVVRRQTQEAMDNLKISTYKKRSHIEPRSKSGRYPVPDAKYEQVDENIRGYTIGVTRPEIRRSLKSFGRSVRATSNLGATR